MVNVLNCALIALGFDLVGTFKLQTMSFFTLTLGDSYFLYLAYSWFPITTGLKDGVQVRSSNSSYHQWCS